MENIFKINWLDIFYNTIEEGYPSYNIFIRPLALYLNHDNIIKLELLLSEHLSKLLGINNHSRIKQSYYDLIERDIEEKEWEKLPLNGNVKIISSSILVLIIKEYEEANEYQIGSFNKNILYAKNIFVHKLMNFEEEFVNHLDNWI